MKLLRARPPSARRQLARQRLLVLAVSLAIALNAILTQPPLAGPGSSGRDSGRAVVRK